MRLAGVVVALVCSSCGRIGFDAATPDGMPTDPYSTEVLADAPVAYWRLADPTGEVAHDETGNYPGAIEGACQFGVTGITAGGNAALRFDGASCRIVIGDVLPFTGTVPFTFELWMNPDAIDGLVRWALDRETLSGARSGYQLAYQDVDLWFERFTLNASATYLGAGGPPALARFQHVVVTFEGGTERMFVDGVEVNAGVTSFSAPPDPGLLVLGDGSRGNLGKFSGVLDEVAIYDHALSAARIAAHFGAR